MLKDLSDDALMNGYLNGDAASFELIYARYAGKVMAYLRSRLRGREEQEEVFQSIFMKFHKSRHLYDPKFPLLQWLYVISRSVYLDRLKQTQRKHLISDAVAMEAKEFTQPVRSGLDSDILLSTLDETQREIIERRILNEENFEEIAIKLQLTPSNVRQKLSRALKKMRLSLKASEGESK